MAKSQKTVRRILNCVPSRETENDWTTVQAVEANVMAAAPPLPESRDLREAWWKVGDQGETGSCVGWATADSLLRWHLVKANRISETDILSARFTWMAAKETDEFTSMPTTFIETVGTSLKAALDIARKFGVVTNDVLPFGSGILYRGDARTFYALAARLKIISYFNLGRDQTAWRLWLATQGPILTRLNVDQAWYEATANKGMLDGYKPETAVGGHAVAFVGYTKDRLIVRNSWGEAWGDKGFGYASRDYASAAFTEAYGVTVI